MGGATLQFDGRRLAHFFLVVEIFDGRVGGQLVRAKVEPFAFNFKKTE